MTPKIGLITYHNTANHGAALQLYATLKKVEELGFCIEVIDYSNSIRSSFYDPKRRIIREFKSHQLIPLVKTLVGYSTILKRLNSFNEFYSTYTKRSEDSYNEFSDLSKLNEKYDILLCGSDQIWSVKNNGNDMNYLLSFANNKPELISYASSLGMARIEPNHEHVYKRLLSRFSKLSVREKSGAKVLERLLNQKVEVVLDPVFLLSRNDWASLAGIPLDFENSKEQEKASENYLLDYTAHKGVLEKFLKIDLVAEHFDKVIKYGTNFNIRDLLSKRFVSRPTSSPIEFIQALDKAKFLFTTSFHGTVLAIIFRKQFVTALSGNEGRDSRIIDLLTELNLTSRIFNENMKADNVFSEIDYDAVEDRLSSLRLSSSKFLASALSEAKEKAIQQK